jgi:N-terminal half of MaoC dehydratase
MANRAAQGAVGEPFAMDIERGKIREFADATKSANPAYWDDDRPVIPPTFLITQMFWERWAGEAAFPWPLVELDQRSGMHAEQEFVFFGPPPRAGMRLTAQSRIGDIYSKRSRAGATLTFAVMITEFRDETGRVVAEARLTGVESAPTPEEQP